MNALDLPIRVACSIQAGTIARALPSPSNCMVRVRAPFPSSQTDPVLHGRERAGRDDAVGAPLFAAAAASTASRPSAWRRLHAVTSSLMRLPESAPVRRLPLGLFGSA